MKPDAARGQKAWSEQSLTRFATTNWWEERGIVSPNAACDAFHARNYKTAVPLWHEHHKLTRKYHHKTESFFFRYSHGPDITESMYCKSRVFTQPASVPTILPGTREDVPSGNCSSWVETKRRFIQCIPHTLFCHGCCGVSGLSECGLVYWAEAVIFGRE